MASQSDDAEEPKRKAEWLDDPQALAQFDMAVIDWGRRSSILVMDVPALRLLHLALTADMTVARRQRVMYLAFDIKVAYANTSWHIHELAGSENKHLVNDEDRSAYRPFTNPASFGVAMLRSRAAFALIARVRALWDKLFLYLATRFDGEDSARRLQGSRSKRKFFFRTYGAGVGDVTAEMMNKALTSINELERSYRSPELHGFGVVPPWVFESPPAWPYGHTSPIIGHWAAMHGFLHAAFAEAKTGSSSYGSLDVTEGGPG